jgi:hypothetical protein
MCPILGLLRARLLLMTTPRRLIGELLRTALLVVASGIMGERRSSGNAAIALLAHIGDGATLVTLIFTSRAVSGATFQSCRHARGRGPGRAALARCFGLYRGASFSRVATV